MILAALSLAAAAGQGCNGFYSYIPRHPRDEVPFSIQIRDKRVSMKAMDFSGFDVQAEERADHSLSFADEQASAKYRLICRRGEASVTIIYARGKPVTQRLVRTRTDIFGVAREKGWPIGD